MSNYNFEVNVIKNCQFFFMSSNNFWQLESKNAISLIGQIVNTNQYGIIIICQICLKLILHLILFI